MDKHPTFEDVDAAIVAAFGECDLEKTEFKAGKIVVEASYTISLLNSVLGRITVYRNNILDPRILRLSMEHLAKLDSGRERFAEGCKQVYESVGQLPETEA